MMRGIYRALLCAMICGAPLFAEKQDSYPEVKASIEPASATVGDPVQYRIGIAGRGTHRITIVLPEKKELYPEKEKSPEKQNPVKKEPDPKEDVPLYVIHGAKKEDHSDGNITDLSVLLEISYYRPGRHQLPEIEILGDDNKRIGYKIPEIEIKEINAKSEFENIEPPLDLGGNYTRLVLLLLAAAGATSLGFLVAWYIKKRRMRALFAPAPEVPPIEIFMRDINKFNGQRLIADGKIEEYVFGIAHIFRHFLSLQYRFVAAEMTSDEIMEFLGKKRPDFDYAKHENDLSRMFRLWDISRYAEFAPSAEILSDNLDNTVKLAKTLSEARTLGQD